VSFYIDCRGEGADLWAEFVSLSFIKGRLELAKSQSLLLCSIHVATAQFAQLPENVAAEHIWWMRKEHQRKPTKQKPISSCPFSAQTFQTQMKIR